MSKTSVNKRFFFGSSKPDCPNCNKDMNVTKNDSGQWCCTNCDWVDDEGSTGNNSSISRPISIYLKVNLNGYEILTRIPVRGFDAFSVVIQVEKKQQMIFKHPISTIQPETHVDIQIKD